MTGSGMRPLDLLCGEQSKLRTAQAFKLAERDKSMSEQERQKSSYMQELDRWIESNVIGPLFTSEAGEEDWEQCVERVKKAIRAKVLESYRNGQVAGPRRVVREPQKVAR